MAIINIDHQPYEIKDGKNLLEVILNLGFNLPYFCWHPALGSVGACRQCAVKVYKNEQDQKGRIMMACMTPASNGTYLSIKDLDASNFRTGVVELLMTNHPHDCPICDEGGECHLQDMTVMNGHNYRSYRFPKRTFHNQEMGPFINHEMDRCIQCYRCVRFYRDYAGGRDLDAFALHDTVYFGRQQDGLLESEFSGNLVEVCPTGVFTDKTLKKHYSRKWDLQTAPSICVHCSLGCNIIPAERYGMLRRIYNRYNGEVNGYFLCDRGRFGYEFVNSERRIRQASSSHGSTLLGKEEALQHAGALLSNPGRVIGIGSPRASLESNFALCSLVGPDHFYAGVSAKEYRLTNLILSILQKGPAHTPSLREVGLADAVFVIGEDVTNTAPMLALQLRQAVRQQPMKKSDAQHIPRWEDAAVREQLQEEKGPFFIASPVQTRLDDIATQTYHAAPDDIARLGFAVAYELNPAAPQVSGLSDELHTLAAQIAKALKEADRPLIVSGASLASEAVIQAAANIARALSDLNRTVELFYTLPEANSMGLAMLGGADIQSAVDSLRQGKVDTLIVLENDLYHRLEPKLADELLHSAKHVVVLDHLVNKTSQEAELVLPAAAYAEGDGALVNNEGRIQRYYQVYVPAGDIQDSWRWLQEIQLDAGLRQGQNWRTVDEIDAALVSALPVFAPLLKIAPPASFRINGEKIARQPARYSGRTAMNAAKNVSEPEPPDDPDTPFSFSMEGADTQVPPALLPRYWSPAWNSVQALNKFQSEIGGPLRGGDPGKRLIEPPQTAGLDYFKDVPAAFDARQNEWLVVPLYHIHGSEELSSVASSAATLVPQPYLALNPQDMSRLQIKEGEVAELDLDGTIVRLPVKPLASLPLDVAGFPMGLAGLPHLSSLPGWGSLQAASELMEGTGK